VIEVSATDLQQPHLLAATSSTAVNSTSTETQVSTTNSPNTTNDEKQAPQPSLRSLGQLTTQLPFPTIFGADASKPLQVGIKLKEQSWLRVEADGKTLFEGVLTEGTEKAWGADKTVTLRAGNAGGVLVAVNNGAPKPMGDSGAVEEMTIAANANPRKSSNF
jgi:cytoskeletal protein RodZ